METLLVIGLGSMGKRRARLLKRARPQAALCGVDLSPARREEAEALGIRAYESLEAALAAKAPRAAFVCTAPVTHAAIIARLLQAGVPVFTELNLVDDGYDELTAAARERACRCFCPAPCCTAAKRSISSAACRNFQSL